MSEFSCRLCGKRGYTVLVSFEAWLDNAKNAEDQRKQLAAITNNRPELNFGDIVQCETCGLRSVARVPTSDALASFYKDYYGTQGYDSKKKSKIKRASRYIRRLRKRVRIGEFLDIGCNLGFAVEAASRMGFSATGIEVDPVAVESARSYFPRSEFLCLTAEEFAATGRTFDLVYCSEVIEHVPDINVFAGALSNLTKIGGCLFLTTPDATHFRVPRDFVRWPEVKPPEHLTWFAKPQLSRLFRDQGFAVKFQFAAKPGVRMLAQRLDRS